ncbi:hypothetical protein HGRIS_014834 [Hohenbuehelia grisea]|uniref:Uncharacterized protein n=1 Tax=Hohenbuehelia grisea TaxID=104357 RepID=A0ABR3IQW4_9AGAR
MNVLFVSRKPLIDKATLASGSAMKDLQRQPAKEFRTINEEGFKLCTRQFMKFVMLADNPTSASTSSALQPLAEAGPDAVHPSPAASASSPDPTCTADDDSVAGPGVEPAPLKIKRKRRAQPSQPGASAAPQTQDGAHQAAVDIACTALADAGIEVGDALLAAVAKLGPAAMATRISVLAKMSRYELQREDNIAQNAVLLAQLGIPDVVQALSKSTKQPAPQRDEVLPDENDYMPDDDSRKDDEPSVVPTRRSSRFSGKGSSTAQAQLPDNDASAAADEQPSGDGHELGSSATAQVPAARDNQGDIPVNQTGDPVAGTHEPEAADQGSGVNDALNASPAPLSPAAPAASSAAVQRSKAKSTRSKAKGRQSKQKDSPKDFWFVRAWAAFKSVDMKFYGPRWKTLIGVWKVVEGNNGFQAEGPMLPAAHHPSQVNTWIKSARPFHRLFPVPDPIQFSSTWWLWWTAINPDWRVRDGDRLVVGGTGAWEDSLPLGQNGVLSVIVALWYWRKATPTASPAVQSWCDAVDDVAWALRQAYGVTNDELAAQVQELEESDSEPPQKRQQLFPGLA